MANTKESKLKSKILKVKINSGSDTDDSEHELAYYMKDKVKLMKEVLKLIKPKKIKSMAPECMKHLDIGEINSMLLEELLGISNKRLRYIFNGDNVDRETSSSESDEEKKPIDVVSLDDISDDDIEVTINSNATGQNKRRKPASVKKESLSSNKKQKLHKNEHDSDNLKESERHKLMSVLELLELQARARAIKSQLALEANRQSVEKIILQDEDDSDPDAVIIESPKHKQIVLTSSDSEDGINVSENGIESTNQKQCKAANTTLKESIATESIIISDEDNTKTKMCKINNKMLDLKQQKLLSKIKKIKLVRHKSLIQELVLNKDGSNCEQKINDVTYKNESELCITDEGTTASNITNETSLSLSNNENKYAVNPETGSTSLNTKVESCQATKQENSKSEDCTNNTNQEKGFYRYEIDNEIVVINVDEDEMKGIEND